MVEFYNSKLLDLSIDYIINGMVTVVVVAVAVVIVSHIQHIGCQPEKTTRSKGVASQNSTLLGAITSFPVMLLPSSPGDV